MKRDFSTAHHIDSESDINPETARAIAAETELASDASAIMEALSYCLECLFRGQKRLPEEIEESVSPDMLDHALDITDQIVAMHNPSKEECHRYHFYNDTHPNVAWPYALIDVIADDLELPIDESWQDTVSHHAYFEGLDPEQVSDMSPIDISMQKLLSDTLAEQLDGFMRAASAVIGRHFNMGTVLPPLVFTAFEDASAHYEKHGMHITEIDIETWFPNFYDDALEEMGMKEALVIYDQQIH